MSLLNPSPDELNALLVRIADGLPGHALDAHAALASLSTALDQKIAAVAVLEKRVRELDAYRNSIRSIDMEFETPAPGVCANCGEVGDHYDRTSRPTGWKCAEKKSPAAPSSPPRLTLVPWADEPEHAR